MTRVSSFLLLALAFAILLFAAACGGGEKNPFNVKSEVVTAADNAAAMVFAPDGRLFYGEQITGNIRVIGTDGKLQTEPFATLGVETSLEWGLTGLALDPGFESNHYVYAYYTEPKERDPDRGVLISRPVVVRLRDENGRGVEPKVLVADLPETALHHEGINGSGRIRFGPDGFLYISLGDYDASEMPFAQDLSSPIGKLLRVNKDDGTAAAGNPFAGDPAANPRIYAYGFREPFDFVFHPETGEPYGADNTPVTCEEINIIEPGGNYGWPNVGEFPFADCTAGEGTDGIYFLSKENTRPEDFLSAVVVSGLEFASGAVYPTLGDSLIACERETSLLRRLVLTAPEFRQVTANDVVVKDCKLGVAVSPDGIIYYSNEREIRRLTPVPVETGQ